MKRISSRIRNIGERVASVNEAAQSVVRTAAQSAAELRQNLTTATRELESLKTEMPNSVADLRTDSGTQLTVAMAEVNDADELFAQAGYAIDGIDLELTPMQRLFLHLIQVRQVAADEIYRLSQAQPVGTLRAILTALVRARRMADTGAPDGLPDERVVIALGPTPSVRLTWRNDSNPAPVVKPGSQTSCASSSSMPEGFFGSSSRVPFQSKTSTRAAKPRPAAEPVATPEASSTEASSPEPTTVGTTAAEPAAGVTGAATPAPAPAPEVPAYDPADPLARFKVMPRNLTRN